LPVYFGARRPDQAGLFLEAEGAPDVFALREMLEAVRKFMLDRGGFVTLAEIARELGFPEASVSARLRDLRKPRFGGHLVERRRVSGGLFEYRLQRRAPVQLPLMPGSAGMALHE
jgi:hypothetical protein